MTADHEPWVDPVTGATVQRARGGRSIDIVIQRKRRRSWLTAWLLRLPRETEDTYIGSCTVWHRFPSGRRCCTFVESSLSEIEDRWARRHVEF